MTGPDHDVLVRLLTAAHAATREVAHDVNALQLYRDARDAAEARLPGPLGTAVAAVLAIAAEHRRLAGVGGSLGAEESMLALALAVRDIEAP